MNSWELAKRKDAWRWDRPRFWQYGEIGRRKRLKIARLIRIGSNPIIATNFPKVHGGSFRILYHNTLNSATERANGCKNTGYAEVV